MTPILSEAFRVVIGTVSEVEVVGIENDEMVGLVVSAGRVGVT